MNSGAKSIWNKRPPVIVGIAGGSGSGKTWLANRLLEHFKKEACILSLDDFYRDRSNLSPARRRQINFDHPRSIDWPALHTTLERIRNGEPALVPIYDFSTHSRGAEQRKLVPRSVLIVEGLWLFYRRSLRRLFDLSIYIDCPADVRLQRRIARDCAERGHTEDSVRHQFMTCVSPMHDRFVEAQRRWADIVLTELTPGEIQAVAARIKELTINRLP